MRLALACFAAAFLAAPAWAQPAGEAPDTLNQVYACAQNADDAARLACYDAAVNRLRQAQTAGDLVAVDRSAVESIEREGFGLQLPSLPRLLNQEGAREELAEMNFVVERVITRPTGRSSFVMTDGQIWTQVETTSASRVRAGGQVRIRRASFGSFMMSVEAGGPALRVRREQ